MFFPHTDPYISKSMLGNNADVHQCSYFELGLPVVQRKQFRRLQQQQGSSLFRTIEVDTV